MDSCSLKWGNHELMYCANVHPTSHTQDLIEVVDKYSSQIKHQRGLESMCLGGWLNEALLQALCQESEALLQWKQLLIQQKFLIKTLNAFPQAKFHGEQIKEKVYLPDWSMPERLKYTQTLADFIQQHQDIFAAQVTISTVPLGYKSTWSDTKNRQATTALITLANHLKKIHSESGVHIRVCLEMEPDCQLESVNDLVTYFKHHLNIDDNVLVRDYLGICFDVCHQSVMHENITATVNKIRAAGIVIGKVQISSAIRVRGAINHEQRVELAAFQHSPYLHQVKVRSSTEQFALRDLQVSALAQLNADADTRIHLHVPIHLKTFSSGIETTQQQILEFLSCLPTLPYKPDIEVETYTWGILNQEDKKDLLANNLIKEINWLEAAMRDYGLMESEK